MKRLSRADYLKLKRLTYRAMRPVDFALWKYSFEGGSQRDVLDVLSCYQNEDGGFGHALEANCWNPASSPSVTAFAVEYLKLAHVNDKEDPVIQGILRYLSAGEYLTDAGWPHCVPSNNDYSHAPWFHYAPPNDEHAATTAALAKFILKFGERDSEFYKRAILLANNAAKADFGCYAELLPFIDIIGQPDGLTRAEFIAKLQAHVHDRIEKDPANWLPWMARPSNFVDSPASLFYHGNEDLVNQELDIIVEKRQTMTELPIAAVDKDNVDQRQIIGNYYWEPLAIIHDLKFLNSFGRLDFMYVDAAKVYSTKFAKKV